MLPVTSVIPVPIPEHIVLDHDLGLFVAALLVALVLGVIVALLGAASADRSARADDEVAFFAQTRERGSAPAARTAKRKRHPLAA